MEFQLPEEIRTYFKFGESQENYSVIGHPIL